MQAVNSPTNTQLNKEMFPGTSGWRKEEVGNAQTGN